MVRTSAVKRLDGLSVILDQCLAQTPLDDVYEFAPCQLHIQCDAAPRATSIFASSNLLSVGRAFERKGCLLYTRRANHAATASADRAFVGLSKPRKERVDQNKVTRGFTTRVQAVWRCALPFRATVRHAVLGRCVVYPCESRMPQNCTSLPMQTPYDDPPFVTTGRWVMH